MYVSIYSCMYVCMYVSMNVCDVVLTWKLIPSVWRFSLSVPVFVRMLMCVNKEVCMHACWYVCMYIYYVACIYAHT